MDEQDYLATLDDFVATLDDLLLDSGTFTAEEKAEMYGDLAEHCQRREAELRRESTK